jgi:Domain of unknown function (DUF5658)
MRLQTAWFGNLVVIAFLLAQACDGVLTYVGISLYGLGMEGNPILGWMMAQLGHGVALTAAKGVAGGFGILLHLGSVHRVLAALAAFYFVVAVVPWVAILFF